jgi:hypothetical protein
LCERYLDGVGGVAVGVRRYMTCIQFEAVPESAVVAAGCCCGAWSAQVDVEQAVPAAGALAAGCAGADHDCGREQVPAAEKLHAGRPAASMYPV